MDPKDIGGRLKAIRTRRGMSLRALSRSTTIAVSFLSAIEQGLNNVSVAKLKAILDALGTNLSEFFSDESKPPQTVYRKRELVEIAGQGRGISYREVAAGRAGRALQLMVENYQPGADTGAELYTHLAEEAGVVLKGKLELTVESEIYVLGPGDAFYFDSSRPHRFRNLGSTEVLAVSVNTPPSF
jgi:transcriptional regulator with XRE-family HTH domain